ncbi:MAG TPA: cell division protein FtsB [Zeimonas sp.]
MRTLGIVLACLLALIQYPLWLGKGGWLRVWELDRQLEAQQALNARIASRNDALEAEVADLRAGQQALEERARYDLGMVKPGELFVQINEATASRSVPDDRVRTAAAGDPR